MASDLIMQSTCCPTNLPPVKGNADYQRQGTLVKVDDFDLYTVGQGNKVVLALYDVFGMHPNFFQGCDIIASSGLRVVLPDFFKGDKWSGDFSDMQKFYAWIGKASDPVVLGQVYSKTIEYLQKEIGDDFTVGTLGFCWGAKPALEFAAKESRIKAVGGIHPSMITLEHMKAVNVPIMELNSKDEAAGEDLQAELKSNANTEKNIWRVYPTMTHGWCGARGDWTNEEVAKEANEAFGITATFFKSNI